MHRILIIATLAVALSGSAVACSDDSGSNQSSSESTQPADSEATPPTITAGDIDPANFVDRIDNPYLPLEPGARWVYEGQSEDGAERTVVVVTDDTKEIMGVTTTVVRDTVSLEGEVVEDTLDWYAQDRDGNVWYFGEAVQNFENGQLSDTDGSFEAGVDGALPGIVMEADPQVGDFYYQEYYPGEAEDTGKVLRLGESVGVPAGSFDEVLVTEDINPLEPDIVENKFYAPGVGVVREEHTTGPAELTELVRVQQP